MSLRPSGTGVPGQYVFSGRSSSLSELSGPGRRKVVELDVSRVGPAESWEGLAAFESLDAVRIERCEDVDLEPLWRAPRLRALMVFRCTGVRFGDIAELPHLEGLFVEECSDVQRSSRRISLPRVRGLATTAGPGGPGDVDRLLGAIDWRSCARLERLTVRGSIPPVRVDLSFLAELPRLRALELEEGVRHDGPGVSPLVPPFVGLPSGLEHLSFEADDPEAVRRALAAHDGRDEPWSTVREPIERSLDEDDVDDEDPRSEQAWVHPSDDGRRWLAYVRFAAEAEERGEDVETEHEALAAARRRLRSVDRRLEKRLDFDQEADGTGIAAAERADLVAALAIWDLIDD